MSRDLSDDARSLIRHALAEEAPPTHVHRQRLRRAVLARAAAGGGGAALLVGTSVAKAGGKSLLLSALGSAGIGLGAGIVFVSAAHFAFDTPAKPPAAALGVAAPAAVAPKRTQAAARAPGANVEPSTDVEPPSAAEPEPASVEQAAADAPPSVAARGANAPGLTPAASAAPGSALRAELDLLADVQGALRDGQAARALDLCARYDARFPRGSLTSERLAAEVFAACQIGDRARAQRVAAKFLRSDGTSALAARVRKSCANAD